MRSGPSWRRRLLDDRLRGRSAARIRVREGRGCPCRPRRVPRASPDAGDDELPVAPCDTRCCSRGRIQRAAVQLPRRRLLRGGVRRGPRRGRRRARGPGVRPRAAPRAAGGDPGMVVRRRGRHPRGGRGRRRGGMRRDRPIGHAQGGDLRRTAASGRGRSEGAAAHRLRIERRDRFTGGVPALGRGCERSIRRDQGREPLLLGEV